MPEFKSKHKFVFCTRKLKYTMKIKMLAFSAVLGLSLGVNAQKNDLVSIEWGENAPLIKKHFSTGFVGSVENGFIQISQNVKKKEIGLYRFGKKLNFEGNHMEVMPKSKYLMFENTVEFDGRSFLLFSDYDKAAVSEKLLVQEIDMKSGEFKGPLDLLIETNGKVSGTYIMTGLYSYAVTDKFKVIAPENSDKILLYYKYKNEKKRDDVNYEKYAFHLLDRNWKTIWTTDVTMPYTEAQMKIRNIKLVGEEVVLFVETMSGRINPDTKKPSFDELGVLQISKGKGKPKEHKLEIDKLFFKDLIFGTGFGNAIMIGGYVQPKKNSSVSQGYFTAVFNPETYQLESVNQYEFKDDLIRAFESARTKRKLDKAIAKGKEPGIPYLETREIVKKADGGWYFIGEQYHLVVTSSMDSKGNVRYTYHHYFQDMIVSSISADGAEEWTVKTPKNQHFINTTYGSGISSFVHNNSVYIFHLDNVKNKVLSEDAAPAETKAGFKEACLMVVKIDEKGNMTRKSLFDLKDESKIILPETIEEVAPGILLSSSRRAGRGAPRNTNMPAMIYLK